ncbi:MAG: hypothetical protein K9L84_03555 [Candidatus Omnitrophica bacterium]|nr:hypothetical protein [Candidatus Omnitrophota bacterium]MCF7894115.1 hypothetical protein [Candidatus Omnitrophota bacterium]
MRKFIFLTILNFKIIIKEKTFWAIGFLFIFLLGFSLFLGQLSLGEKYTALKIAALSIVEATALLLIAIGFVFNFYKEKETRLQEVYLSHFSSLTYLGAKLAGYLLTCFFYIIIASFCLILILGKNFNFFFLLGPFGIFLKLSIFCALALLLSVVFNYPLLSASCLFFLYIGAELAYGAYKVAGTTKIVVGGVMAKVVYYIIPNADKLDFKYLAVYGQSLKTENILFIVSYVICYILFCFFLANLIFSYKEH